MFLRIIVHFSIFIYYYLLYIVSYYFQNKYIDILDMSLQKIINSRGNFF